MEKQYYSIGEVCNLLELKPNVLRYWEGEFYQLKPKRRGSRNRKYTLKNIELLKKIKYLLYTEKFTIKGAKKTLREDKNNGQLKVKLPVPGAKQEIKSLLDEIKDILIGP